MIEGRVKWFNAQKGFGFVEAQGKDYFLHFSEIDKEGYKTLDEGDRISFVPSMSPKGPTATRVQLSKENAF
jgi:CspA family cold shock protein